MGLLNPHLDDGAFAQLWTDRRLGDGDSSRSVESHLQVCPECRRRFASFADWLETIGADARSEAEEVFTSDRLATQQAQILRRLEAAEHPARVIAFPRFAQPVSTERMPRRRWVAVAAAAGLVVGVGLGQVFELGVPRSVTQVPPQIVASIEPHAELSRVVQSAALTVDDAFVFDEPASATSASVPESLQYLNAITPTSRDFDPR